MKEIHKVSVVIPIYNVQEYLNECVSSIVNQTYQNLEIILVDDGSPDSCPIMCDCNCSDILIRISNSIANAVLLFDFMYDLYYKSF